MTLVVKSRPMMDNPFRTDALCVWPDCASSHVLASGPRTPGWVTAEAGLRAWLCPFHAESGHRPRRIPCGSVILPSCTCRWTGLPLLTSGLVVSDWAVHVRRDVEGTLGVGR